MKLNITLATATAMGLLMGAAHAQSNSAYIDQNGDGNSASIRQLGEAAKAGDSTAGRRMLQNGEDNTLTILQNDNGTVGTGGNYSQNNLGVDQAGDRNDASITQTFGSGVYEVQQDATGATGAVSAATNVLSITQTGNMRVNRVRQTYTGDGSTDAANSLTITQTGSQFQNSFIGNSNGLQFASQGAFQTGHSNDADVSQTGAGHTLIRLDQNGVSNDFDLIQGGGNGNKTDTAEQVGDRNTGYLSFSGANNGTNGFTSGTAAALAGAATRSMSQLGDDNDVNMAAVGGSNEYGFYQDGDRNSAVGITILGNFNQLAVKQVGDDNTLDLGTVDGSFNNVGLSQDGSDNTATVSITGDSNGGASAFTALTPAGSLALTAGLMTQLGSLNSIDLTVDGDSNAFAIQQIGDENSASGDQIGNSNQVAVAQNGNSNIASFSQTGSSNNIGISQ